MNRIAVIGSGITGLSFVNHTKSVNITLFDKARKAGGRISTRTSRQLSNIAFDHGMHFLDPSVSENSSLIKKLAEIGCSEQRQVLFCENLQDLKKPISKKIVFGRKNAQTISDALLETAKTQTHFDTRISVIERNKSKQYYLESQKQERFGPFDRVYAFIPYQQCKLLKLTPKSVNLDENIDYVCNWTVMMSAKGNWKLNPSNSAQKPQVLQKISEHIGKAVNQNIKHNPNNAELDDMWVFNMADAWSQKHVQDSSEEVSAAFLSELEKAIQEKVVPSYLKAHRWLYAFPKNFAKQPIQNDDGTLVFSGDWVGGSRFAGFSWEMGAKIASQSKL